MAGNRSQMPTPPSKKDEVSLPGADEETLPALIQEEEQGEVVQAKETASGIEVVALRAGFINNKRYVEGDTFKVSGIDMLGEWMRCTDEKLEKQHQKMIEAKRAKIKANASK